MAQNKLLHNTVSELATALDHMEDDATRRLEQAGGEVRAAPAHLPGKRAATQFAVSCGNRKLPKV